MMNQDSGITWLREIDWIGTELAFDEPSSKWRVTSKIREIEHLQPQDATQMWGLTSEVRALFLCVNDEDPAQEAVVKIRMQIPWDGTWSESPQKRAQQATSGLHEATTREVNALKHLTEARCSSAPRFYAWKTETQGATEWAPGGFRDYIVMEKLPGSRPGKWGFALDPSVKRQERNQIRAAFKKAWKECIASGLFHCDASINNIVWDANQNKCWIIDWEVHRAIDEVPKRLLSWNDQQYKNWDIAEY